jgi:phosphatidylserine/phosphatidylglycerophosphate/cardiolipin synthase-like enzyme
MVNVIVQPRDGIEPLLEAIRDARHSVEIIIYRLDRLEIERALLEAVGRGVAVHVLTSPTNRDDAKALRRMEARLSEGGARLSQTSNDLTRYHNKMMIVDRRVLYLLTFNYTFLDIHHSRSFGIATEDPAVVAEAVSLFEADAAQRRTPPPMERLVVSPINARQILTDFIRGAKRQLLIYDGKLNDVSVIRLLRVQARAGVEIKVIGEMGRRVREIPVQPVPGLHLHAQAMIRDGEAVFLGSQSLRKPELDERREAGIIIRDPAVAKHFYLIFELDWGDIVVPEEEDLTREDRQR